MLKFRTMIPDAERDGPVWQKGGSEKNEGRCVSPALSFGRASSALEYSCGGYELCRAPSRATDVLQRVRKIVKGFEKRLLVKPGLTGLSQINGGYDLTPAEKWLYDMKYIHDRSILLDLKCLIWTVPVILTARGSR